MYKRVKIAILAGLMTLTSLSPLFPAQSAGLTDEEILLELMQIEISENDPLLKDKNYLALVESFTELNDDIDKTAEDFVEVLDSLIVFAENMQKVDDPRFEAFDISKDDINELKMIRDELKNTESISNLLYEELLSQQSLTGMVGSPAKLQALAVADTRLAMPEQRVVLKDYSSYTNPNATSVVWQQVAGPKVQISHAATAGNDRVFIMPHDAEMVAFDLIISENGKTSASTVQVFHDETGEYNIRRMYFELLGRQADPSGLKYWMDRYKNGATYLEILQGFETSPEYLNK